MFSFGSIEFPIGFFAILIALIIVLVCMNNNKINNKAINGINNKATTDKKPLFEVLFVSKNRLKQLKIKAISTRQHKAFGTMKKYSKCLLVIDV